MLVKSLSKQGCDFVENPEAALKVPSDVYLLGDQINFPSFLIKPKGAFEEHGEEGL